MLRACNFSRQPHTVPWINVWGTSWWDLHCNAICTLWLKGQKTLIRHLLLFLLFLISFSPRPSSPLFFLSCLGARVCAACQLAEHFVNNPGKSQIRPTFLTQPTPNVKECCSLVSPVFLFQTMHCLPMPSLQIKIYNLFSTFLLLGSTAFALSVSLSFIAGCPTRVQVSASCKRALQTLSSKLSGGQTVRVTPCALPPGWPTGQGSLQHLRATLFSRSLGSSMLTHGVDCEKKKNGLPGLEIRIHKTDCKMQRRTVLG